MTDIVTLKAICDELKIDPREARERLRATPRRTLNWRRGGSRARRGIG